MRSWEEKLGTSKDRFAVEGGAKRNRLGGSPCPGAWDTKKAHDALAKQIMEEWG